MNLLSPDDTWYTTVKVEPTCIRSSRVFGKTLVKTSLREGPNSHGRISFQAWIQKIGAMDILMDIFHLYKMFLWLICHATQIQCWCDGFAYYDMVDV